MTPPTVKTVALCSSCVLHDLVGALDRLAIEGDLRQLIVRRAVAHLHEHLDFTREPSFHITALHRILKQEAGIALPFAGLRDRCNQAGMVAAEQVRQRAASLAGDVRFRFLCLWAIAGNHLDFRTVGTGYDFAPERIVAMLEESLAEGLAVDRTTEIRAVVAGARRVLFIHDNVGEIALDRLLIEECRSLGAHVTSALRGGPITSDATMEDGEAVRIRDSADEVICAGPDTLGISWQEKSAELDRALQTADLVISKGQANYYVLDEHRGEIAAACACLLRTKCAPVSLRFGTASHAVNIATLL